MAPTPRTSFALVTHKKRAIIFGGVTDQHGKGDHMFSTLHDELYQLNFESQRWYPIAIRVPAKQLPKATHGTKCNGDTEQSSSDLQNAAGKAANGISEDAQLAQPSGSSADQRVGLAGAEGAAQRGESTGGAHHGGAAEHIEGGMQPDLADKLSQAGVDKESALYKAAARIQSRFRGYTVRKV